MDTTNILLLLLGGVVTIVSGVALHRSTKESDTVEEHTRKITALESTAVTDSHVRMLLKEEIKEEITPVKVTMEEVLRLARKIELRLATEDGFKEGYASAARRKTDIEE